jgi:anti-anti-sigma factor
VSHQDAVVWYLRVDQEQADGIEVLTVRGRISSLTTPDLEKALASACGSAARGLVLDLSGVDYISSNGIRAVQNVSWVLEQANRRLVLCGLRDAVSVAFTLAGLQNILSIEPSREAAVARATSTPRAGETAC